MIQIGVSSFQKRDKRAHLTFGRLIVVVGSDKMRGAARRQLKF
jgi:hypothetical protein